MLSPSKWSSLRIGLLARGLLIVSCPGDTIHFEGSSWPRLLQYWDQDIVCSVKRKLADRQAYDEELRREFEDVK
jgi:hypothetical protein